MSSHSNMVNPTSRLSCEAEAGVSARNAEGMAGRGNWRKRMPPCNRVDRSRNITPPCKRADFQLVVHDERTDRTHIGGNRK